MKRDFLDLISNQNMREILDLAHKIKANKTSYNTALKGKKLTMIFEKSSTRTRVSFEAGIFDLGGHAIFLNSDNSQLGRGETIADTARILSGYTNIIMMRTHGHQRLTELAQYASVPVINGLTDLSHPCQIMADILTFEEKIGDIRGKKIAWLGDGNNVLNSWIAAAKQLKFTIAIACPDNLMPDDNYLKYNGNVKIDTPENTAKEADAIITDTWVSMGEELDTEKIAKLTSYQVNSDIMKLANPQAIFMHCLPAYRGKEVTTAVIDGKQSVIWQEAENRLHAQKAIMFWCLNSKI